jgi:hypothetical protein
VRAYVTGRRSFKNRRSLRPCLTASIVRLTTGAHYVRSSDKARRELGYDAGPLAEAVERAVVDVLGRDAAGSSRSD